VLLAITIFHLSLGDIGISMILCMYEAILPVILLVFFFLCTLVPLGILGTMNGLIESYRESNREKMVEGLKSLGGCVFLASVAGYMLFCVRVNGIPLIPDVAVAHIIRAHRKKDEEAEREEMQRLAGDVQ
jgi:hypothetical protein